MHLAHINTRLDIDSVRGARNFLIREKHARIVLTHSLRLEFDSKGVVFEVGCSHRDVETTFVGKSNSDVTLTKNSK